MTDETTPREFTVEIGPAGPGESIDQSITPQLVGTIRSVAYTPADNLPLYDPTDRAPIRNLSLSKREYSSPESEEPASTLPVASLTGSLTLPHLVAGREHSLELSRQGSGLDVQEGDKLCWHSFPFRGRNEADPGGTVRITMADEERAIRRYNHGDLVEIALDLYDGGGIHEVTAWFGRESGMHIREGRSDAAILELRGHGGGEVEATVTVRTRLRSTVLPGTYRCDYVEVRDLGGNPSRIRLARSPYETHSENDIRIRVMPPPRPPGLPPGMPASLGDRTELRDWRYLDA
jgi:hypothetical protein